MSEEITKNTRQAVSSVGNAWIVTDSKSHPGLVYYFNTVTGEAVWNLSDAEIEKARLATKNLESKQGSKPTMCPEPKTNPPKEQLFLKTQHNIGFKSGEQRQTNICQRPPNNIFPTPQPSVYPEMSMNSISAFDLDALSTHLNAINVITTPTVYNSQGWPIQRTQQFILTPTIPVVNQAQTSLDIVYDQLLNKNQTPAAQFNYFQDSPIRQNRVFQRKNNYKQRVCRKSNTYLSNENDLRQKILLKRRLNTNSYHRRLYNAKKSMEDANKMIEEELSTFKSDTVEEKLSSGIEKEPILSKLNLTPLKRLANSDANSNVWYIVVDINMLLEEFKLISMITESDEHCKLMVPESVMLELKDFIASSNNIPARRIFHSLSQLMDDGRAYIGRKPSEDYGDTITNPILKTCFGLLEENYHVILLSNDSELLKFKKFIKLNIVTKDEIKALLEESLYQCQPKYVACTDSKGSAQRAHNFNDDNICNVVTPCQKPATVTNDSAVIESVWDPNKQEDSKIPQVTPLRCTADAAIQTETVTVDSKDEKRDIYVDLNHTQNSEEKSHHSEIIEASKEKSQTVNLNSLNKRREIKLKRSISNQPAESSCLVKSNEKKLCRWRRKRKLCNQADEHVPKNVKQPAYPEEANKRLSVAEQLDSSEFNTQIEQAHEKHNKDVTGPFVEAIGSRESSVVSVNQKIVNFINIEESSTSGIISNSESYIDSEYKMYKENQNEELHTNVSSHIVAYGVDNESMEESLRTKREEWISRFMQIMEEVLSVILHEEPRFLNITLPPPWTLHEAVQCIRKNCNNAAVKIATDKLSSILFDLSDSAGKIDMNMTPCQYMMMYSSGVSLLNTIKEICNCEDIQIAECALQKLLNDIKNPYCDSEVDPQDNSTNIEETSSVNDQAENKSQEKEEFINQVPEKRKLRSSTRNSIKDFKVSPKPVKKILKTNVKSNIFTNINLKKITRQIKNNIETNTDDCKEDVDDSSHLIFSKDINKEIVNDKPSSEPNIVRKFVTCTEFEEKLKDKFNIEDDIILNDDYCSDIINMPHDHGVDNEPNTNQKYESKDIDVSYDLVMNSSKAVEPSCLSNYMFKLMMRICLQEVRYVLNEVKILCDRCYMELEEPHLGANERSELITQVENAESHVIGLCTSLQSMWDRDSNSPSDNIQKALKKAGIDISHIDVHQLSDYWVTIDNSKLQAGVFLDSMREIIVDLKSLK